MRILSPLFLISTAAALTGCGAGNFVSSPATTSTPQASLALAGTVRSGFQPVVGAHVHLFAISTGGYAQSSVSLLSGTATGLADSAGAYVLTDSSGNFAIPAGFACSASTQAYVYASGGNAGGGINSAIGLIAVLGSCPTATNATTAPSLTVNEATTVAAAYTLAGFAGDATHIGSSGSPAALLGVANAVALNANLVNQYSGLVLQTTPAGNGIPPVKTINTLANILHACAASAAPTSTACTSLFAAAQSGGATGAAPTDTATATINIAHYPAAGSGVRAATLFTMASISPAFSPALTNAPNDFTLGITYTGGGINAAFAVAIDSFGNPWFANLNSSSIARLSPLGVPESPSAGFTNGNPAGPVGITVDVGASTWVVEAVSSSVTKYAFSGALLSPLPVGYTGGGIQVPQAIASDAIGNIWVANYFGSVSEYANSGVVISPGGGYTGGGIDEPVSIAIDSQGSVWTANAGQTVNAVAKLSSTGLPMSPGGGYTGGGISRSGAIAIDSQGSAWVANFAGPYPNTLSKLANNGTPLSPTAGFSGGGLSVPFAMAIDGIGNVWTANDGNNTLSEFDNSGNPISPPTGYAGGSLSFPNAIAIDGSGNIWVANATGITVTQMIGAAAPVVTPLALAVKNSTIATRP